MEIGEMEKQLKSLLKEVEQLKNNKQQIFNNHPTKNKILIL